MPSTDPVTGRHNGRRSPAQGFTLTELLLTVAMLAVLGSLIIPAFASTQLRSRSSSCLTNLKHLGTAFIMYENDNLDRVPFAALKTASGAEVSWDDLLNFYLGGRQTREQQRAATDTTKSPTSNLRCPADDTATGMAAIPHHRSYAMPRFIHHPVDASWPPNRNTKTAVGVFLDLSTGGKDERALNAGSAYRFEHDGETLTVPCRAIWHIRGGLVMDDENTILLTDRFSQKNLAGGIDGSMIENAGDHSFDKTPGGHAHGKVNHYLMFDGSVRKLEAGKTLGTGRDLRVQTGLWTINPAD